MGLLDNTYLWTARRSYNATTKSTSEPVPHLSQISAHIGPVRASQYKPLPDAALTSDYQISVDSGTDIATGDVITAITLLDALTPWPGDYRADQTAQAGGDPTSIWQVVFHEESAPGPLAHRTLYVKRSTGKGSPYTL